MYGVKFDEATKMLKVGQVKIEIAGDEIDSSNFDKYNYRLDKAANKLVVDEVDPNRPFHAINYTAPDGATIVSVLPGIVAYRFGFNKDKTQFSIMGREMPEIYSSKINPLTLITEQNGVKIKVSFINEYDRNDETKIIGYKIKKYPVNDGEFEINTYFRIFDGENFVNRFKIADDSVIVAAKKVSAADLEPFFGGYKPEKNRIVEVPFGAEQAENFSAVLRAMESFRDKRIMFYGYNYDVVKRLRTGFDTIRTRKDLNPSIRLSGEKAKKQPREKKAPVKNAYVEAVKNGDAQ